MTSNMKLLNLCCGATRPPSTSSVEWVNIDTLHATLLEGTLERENLNREGNYIDMDVESGALFDFSRKNPGYFDGIIASHCVEHWDCQVAAKIMSECRFLLKPRGILLVSVPDATYFRDHIDEDTPENALRLFGEPIYAPDGEDTFFGYGLWNRFHKTILTEDALWCYFKRAGFNNTERLQFDHGRMVYPALVTAQRLSGGAHPLGAMVPVLNRLPFSLVMMGVKE